MTHYLGPVNPDGRTFNQSTGIDFVPSPGALGGPRFVMLHFDNVNLADGVTLEVPLGYGTDVFDKNSGPDFWSRPINPELGPVAIRISGGTGSARLREYGSGEPSETPGHDAGTDTGSLSNPDPFLNTDPYDEPTYETRLKCNPDFAWQNARCPLSPIAAAVKSRVAAAAGIVFHAHDGHVSSCSGTLIASDLFLTSRHCFKDPAGGDVASASVTFDYATECDGSRPPGHNPRFFKVADEVAAGRPPGGSGSSTDWVVLRLDATPGALPPPLEMRDTPIMAGTVETVFTMHHPNGAAKKTQSGSAGPGSVTGFDFAGGSSGSALFDTAGRLVGGPLCCGSGCGVTFAPIANIIDALENPPAPDRPLDVMVVFDRSGSMNRVAPPIARTKLEEAQDAAALFVQLVREGAGDRLGLVTFSSSATTELFPGPAATAKPALVGPPPYISGEIGDIVASGSTSLGGGVQTALAAIGTTSTNDRALLLLSDGLQNRSPMIESVEGMLGDARLCVIGFGTDEAINGPLLTRIARDHNGQFTRAVDGLALRKFFGLCFGNIFETGALADPDSILRASQQQSEVHKFTVCGEERITLIVGWDDAATPLRAHIATPDGKRIPGERIAVRGRTWAFWRIDLPYQGERDGTWQFVVERLRGGDDVQPANSDVRYFYLVVSNGGPKLTALRQPHHVYTGDPINPLVGLHYPNGTAPHAEVVLEIAAPDTSLGEIATEQGLAPADISADAVDAFHSTLQAAADRVGGLPVSLVRTTVPLFDDGLHEDGAMEPDGIFGNVLENVTRHEGTYEFRAIATFGEGCNARREAFWSIHVEVAVDPGATDVSVTNVTETAEGMHGTLVIVPRDRYDNPLGPGRPDRISVSPIPGVILDGVVRDRGDGSYTVDVAWDPEVTTQPGVIVQQPGRDPVILTPPATDKPAEPDDCKTPAEELLDCLGLPDSDVKKVKVKSVTVQIDLEDEDC